MASLAREAGEPPDPPPARDLRARLRRTARARRLDPGRAGRHVSRSSRTASTRRATTIPAGRGTIFDRTGVQLAIGEQTTTIYADPQQVTNASAVAVAAHRLLGVDPNALYPALLEQAQPVRLRQALRRPGASRALPEEGLRRRLLLPGGAPRSTRSAASARRSSATRASTTRASAASSSQYDRKLSGHPGKQTIVRDATGRAIDVISSSPVQEGRAPSSRRSTTRSRRTRSRCCARPSPSGARRTRRRSCSTRRRARCSRWRRRPATTRTTPDRAGANLTAQPRRHRHLRAGLDVQARHRHRRRSPRGSSSRTTRFTLPICIQVGELLHPRRREARRRQLQRRADPQVLVERRRDHARREARRGRGSTHWIDQLRLRPRDGDRLPR